MSQDHIDERTPLLIAPTANEDQPSYPQSPESSSSTLYSWDEPTPLPVRPLVILNVLNAMQPLVFELIFPFINQMLFETGIVEDPKRVGFYSGLIESIYAFMSFLAILPSSYASDRLGRKPVILVGILGLAISTSFFGISKTYMAMIVSRCISGTMGGTWSSMKIMVGEMTDRTNQGRAFALLTISYRTGQTLGLPLGGYLAHPERRFAMFRSPFWMSYPFSLPCFVSAGIAVCAVIMGCFFLEETLPSKKKSRARSQKDFSVVLPSGETTEVECNPESVTKAPLKSVLTPSVISLLSSTTAMCLVSETLFALYPLFSFTSVQNGGLGVDEAVIGTHLAIRSLLPIPMMWFYPVFQKKLGTVRLYQSVMAGFPFVVLFFPLLNWLAHGGTDTWYFNVALLGYFLVWSWCGLAWTSSSIMVNDASPSANALATINGISQMSIVLPQAIAPAFATSLFAVSIRSKFLGGNLIWVLLFIFACLAAVHSFTLKEPTVDWREELKKDSLESSELLV